MFLKLPSFFNQLYKKIFFFISDRILSIIYFQNKLWFHTDNRKNSAESYNFFKDSKHLASDIKRKINIK